MENNNIIIGGKDPKKTDQYRHIYNYLKDDLQIMKRTWYILNFLYPPTKETYKCKFFYFKREYIHQVAEALNNLDFAAIAQIPHESGDCAYQIEFRYLKSGNVFACQIVETRPDTAQVFYSVTPAIVLYNEDGKKAYTAMANKLKKLQ